MKGAELGRRLGVTGQRISQLLHEKGEEPSRQLLLAFDKLERELDDPFLSACAEILGSDDDRIVEGFTINIYSILRNIDDRQAQHLRDLEASYHEKRRARKRSSDVG